MTRLIVGVASREEARSALANGADGVEAPSFEAARSIVETVAGRCPVGAALGLKGATLDETVEAARQAIAAGADYVVVPFSRTDDPSTTCRRILTEIPRDMLHAAVGRDEPAPASVLSACGAAGFAGARLDIGDGRLLERLPVARLQRFVRGCAAEGLASGLAGRLEAPDMPRLLELEPDALIVSIAGLQHKAGIETAGLARLRALVPDKPKSGADGAPAIAATDRVFLRDLVLPVFVGAYGHEEQSRQRVRFAVDVDVSRIPRAAHDMADIFSYDLILDGIRLLTASGHWIVIESLAERIASRLLRHPRVTRVAVRIEKLDVSPCVVGVEIVRARGEAAGHG